MAIDHGVEQSPERRRVAPAEPGEAKQSIDRRRLFNPAERQARRDKRVPVAHRPHRSPCIGMRNNVAHGRFGKYDDIRIERADRVDTGRSERTLAVGSEDLPAEAGKDLRHVGTGGSESQAVRATRVEDAWADTLR